METMMSKCPNCGWQDARNVQFCPRCGTAVLHGDSQDPVSVNPPSGFPNGYGVPPQQGGAQYNPNAGAGNYGSAPQMGLPKRPGSDDEPSRSQDRVYQQFYRSKEEPQPRQSAPTASAPSEQPASDSPKPDERWNSFTPPAEASTAPRPGRAAHAYSEPFTPSKGTNKGAGYVVSFLDSIWKILIILWILILLVMVCLSKDSSSMLGISLGVFLAGIPVILLNYVLAKVLGTFYEMANDISAIHSALDSIREDQYKERIGSK